MIFIKIGDEERDFNSSSEQWITQKINSRRRDGVPVCARVRIVHGDASMVLQTPGCTSSGGGGGGWNPNQIQQRIYDLWMQRRLNVIDFAPGELIAFLKHIARTL